MSGAQPFHARRVSTTAERGDWYRPAGRVPRFPVVRNASAPRRNIHGAFRHDDDEDVAVVLVEH